MLLRTGHTKIRTGESRVMRRSLPPPQRVTSRRRTEQPEIAFIAESQQLEDARSDRSGLPDINKAFQRIKDKSTSPGEAGYLMNQWINDTYAAALEAAAKSATVSPDDRPESSDQPRRPSELKRETRLLKHQAQSKARKELVDMILSHLSQELRTWYDQEVAELHRIIEDAEVKYKAELEKIKDKYGDDPIRFTKEKTQLQIDIYPDWYKKSQAAEKKLHKREAAFSTAVAAIKQAGITGLSDKEIYALATGTKAAAAKQAKAKGITDEQLAAIWGENIPKQPVPQGISITPEMVEQPTKVIEATPSEIKQARDSAEEAQERGWSCYLRLNTYKVTTSDGAIILVQAFDKNAAKDKAESAGHKVAFVTKKFGFDIIQPSIHETGNYIATMEDGTNVTMVPFIDPATKESALMPKDAALELQQTTTYQDTTGTVQQRLGIAYAAVQQQYTDFQHQVNSGQIRSVGNDEYIAKEDYEALPEHWQSYVDNYGVSALQDKIQLSSNLLRDYKQEDESYDIYGALVTPENWQQAAETHQAINFLFGSNVTNQALNDLRTMRVEVTAPTPVPAGIESKYGAAEWVRNLIERLTPWEEARGQTYIDWMQRPGTMIGDIRRKLTTDEDFKKWYDALDYPQLIAGYGPLIIPAGPVTAGAGILQNVVNAGKWYWRTPSQTVMRVANKIPGLTTTPIIRGIPQMAAMSTRMVTVGVPAYYTAAYIAEVVKDTDFQRKWNIFSNLPNKDKDDWASKCGYPNWEGLTDSQRAAVLARYVVPTSYTTTEWSTALGEYTQKLVDLGQRGSDYILAKGSTSANVTEANIAGEPVKQVGAFGIGAGVGLVEGMMYMGAIPLVLTNIFLRVPTGEAGQYTKMVAGGMMDFFKEVPGTFISGAYGAGRITGLFVLSPETIYKLGKGATAALKASYIPERAMATKLNTIRVVFTAKQLDLLSEMSSAELKVLGTRIGEALMSGKNYVRDFGRLKLEVKTVPYQKVVGNSLWHFCPDMTPFMKGQQVPIKGRLYTSPQAAVAAGVQSLVKGVKATKPGLVEVRVPKGYTIKGAPIEKLLAGGRAVEIEAPLRGALDPIPGRQGKGISSNIYFGHYPIRRFTLHGVDTPITKLTPARLAQIRLMAAQEALADAFLGWSGRLEAIKRDIASSKKLQTTLKNIDKSETSLKTAPDSIVGKNGQIISQIEFKHPTSGLISEKVRGLIINKDGHVLFTRDRADPVNVYDAVGGSCNVNEVLIPEVGKWNYELPPGNRPVVDWNLGFRSQAFGELYMRIKANQVRSLGMYRGKCGEHSVYGIRMFEAKVESPYFDRVKAWRRFQRPTYKYAQPEIAEAFWWDGKSTPKGQVQPWFYDMLAASAKKYGWDMSKVQISRSPSRYIRDTKFPERVAQGKNTDIPSAARKAIEADFLKQTYDSLAVPGLKDYLYRSGADIAMMAELIRGRREAVKWTSTKPTNLQKAANKVIELVQRLNREQKGNIDITPLENALKAWQNSKTKANAQKLLNQINSTSQKLADLANKWIRESNIRDYLDTSAYNERYSTYLNKLVNVGAGGSNTAISSTWERLPEYDSPLLPSMNYALRYAQDPNSKDAFAYTTPYSPPTYADMTGQRALPVRKSPYKTLPYKTPKKSKTPTNITPVKIPTEHRPTPYVERPPKLEVTPKPVITQSSLQTGKKETRRREGPALAVWKQGAYWVSVFPPFRTTGTKPDVVYSRGKPPWGSVITKGRHAPQKTLKSMGKIPPLITVPMGIVTARIKNGRTLTFSRSKRPRRRRGRILN